MKIFVKSRDNNYIIDYKRSDKRAEIYSYTCESEGCLLIYDKYENAIEDFPNEKIIYIG